NAQGVAEFNIEVLASDGTLQNSETFTVRFAADGTNLAPIVGADGPFTVYAPQAIDIPVAVLMANDSDPEATVLTFVSAGPGAHGTVSVLTQNTASTADDVIRYLPTIGYAGNDQFIYTVSDGVKQSSGNVAIVVDGTYSGYTQGTSGNNISLLGSSYFGGAGDDVILGGLRGGSYAGGTGNDILIGLAGANKLDGNEGNDLIIGGLGRDTISGGAGNDTLTGGASKDTFIFHEGDGSDVITDFDAGRRTRQNFVAGDMITIDLAQINSFNDLMGVASQESDGVLFAFGGGNDLFLKGTMLAALDKDSFTFV
ncbi:MAG: Ig-like domain-containing protein, partial [Hyphomicrobiaceae bacterium]